ncbi:hypothetical protein E4U43_003457 [Claviceps pusilla]|uniref:Uncharacterized protein n=1 Tax=Claviceps pusilla TaxID=123648 RepID=A0A9P7SUJ3_9HYPO|nr:hypothetical protein E4U43_003457 [Claviceps pusilla]
MATWQHGVEKLLVKSDKSVGRQMPESPQLLHPKHMPPPNQTTPRAAAGGYQALNLGSRDGLNTDALKMSL